MKPNPPNEFRYRKPFDVYATTDDFGMNGAFFIPLKGFGHRIIARCIVSDGTDEASKRLEPKIAGWQHVSVCILEYGKERTPKWQEMCAVKDLFWNPDEWVLQYHPAEKDYINQHDHVLHLWKPPVEFPIPPKVCV